jgi:hypothetical protein
MIRPKAASKVAHELLDPYVREGMCSAKMVEMAALLIQTAVEIDETQQKIEAQERVPA